jgi:predicted permease
MVNIVSPGHLEALGVHLLAGRDFTHLDTSDRPQVAIVNETLARLVFPGADPIGKRLRIGGPDAPVREVVGVARDGKYFTLTEPPRPYLYRPLGQVPRNQVALQLRTTGESPLAFVDAVRREARALDPRLPVYGVRPLSEHLDYALWWTRMGATLSAIFGLLATLLAAIGLYGLIAYRVSRRTREIGIRMALGASPRAVVRMVVGEGARLAAVGLALGIAGAAGLARAMNSLLVGVGVLDPATFLAVPLFLAAVALTAGYLPARRAAGADPLAALRYE